jgi:mRNA interferase YafQ
MLAIKRTTAFKQDLKRCKKQGKNLEVFEQIGVLLQSGKSLPEKNRDHALSGNWRGFRECHLAPDWLLMYRIVEEEGVLEFARMGSHSELFS